MHDIPPPTRLDDGSLSIDLKEQFTVTPAGGRFLHTCVPAGSQTPFISHLRVLQGNGDVIYQDLDAGGSVIRIDFRDTNGNTWFMTISGTATAFEVDSDARLNGPGNGRKGRRRYDHPGKGNAFDIIKITVEKPAAALVFVVNAPPPTTYKEEYSVLIWHVGHTQTTTPSSPAQP